MAGGNGGTVAGRWGGKGMIAYAVIAILAVVALWLALEWHRAVEERDTAIARLLEAEAQLAAVPIDAILALNGPDDYDFSGLTSDIEKFAAWLEPLREQRKAVQHD